MDHFYSTSKTKSKQRDKSSDTVNENKQNIKRKNIGQFILGDKIGEGTFGVVRLGTHLLTGEKVAIKILERKRILEEADKTRVEREIKILKCLRHNNIIQLYSVIQTVSSIYLIMEFASGKELFNHIVVNKSLKEDEACKLFQQMIYGIEYLHKLRIVHRDLKPENLLLDYKKNIKIVDFGLSNLYHKGELLSTSCGSRCYAPPEMINGKKYECCKVDIWSSGIILFAMLCGYLPFEDQDYEVLFKKIVGGQFTIPKFVSEPAKDLLRAIINTDPNKRYTIKQIKAHPWFNSITPQINLNEGLLINYHVIPIDEDIVKEMLDYGFNKEEIRTNILTNRHNHVTTTFYLLLKIKTKKGQSSVSDLISEEFTSYMNETKNLFSNFNCDLYQVIKERSKSIKQIETNHNYDQIDTIPNTSSLKYKKDNNEIIATNHYNDQQENMIKSERQKIIKPMTPNIRLNYDTNKNETVSSLGYHPFKHIVNQYVSKKNGNAHSQIPPPKKRIPYLIATQNESPLAIPKSVNKTPEPLNKYMNVLSKNKAYQEKTKYAFKALNYKKNNYLPTDAIDTLHLKIQNDQFITNKAEDKNHLTTDINDNNLNSARNPQHLKYNILINSNHNTISNSPSKNDDKPKMINPIRNFIPKNINKMIQFKRHYQPNFFNTTMSFEKDPDAKNATFDNQLKKDLESNTSANNEDNKDVKTPLNNNHKNLTPNEVNYLNKKSANKKFDIIKEEEEYSNLLLSKKNLNNNEQFNLITNNKARNYNNQDYSDKKHLNIKHQTQQYTTNTSRVDQQNDHGINNNNNSNMYMGNHFPSYAERSKQYALLAKHQKHKSDHSHPYNNSINFNINYPNANKNKIQKNNSIESHHYINHNNLINTININSSNTNTHLNMNTITNSNNNNKGNKVMKNINDLCNCNSNTHRSTIDHSKGSNCYKKANEIITKMKKENMKCDTYELNEYKGPMDISCVSFKTPQLLKEDIIKVLPMSKILFKNSTIICDSNGIKFDIEIHRSNEIENSHFVKFKKIEGDNNAYRDITKYILSKIL